MSNYDTDRDGFLNFHEFSVMVGQNRDKFPINWENGDYYSHVGYHGHHNHYGHHYGHHSHSYSYPRHPYDRHY